MANGSAIVEEYNSNYLSAYYCWNAFYPLADNDLRYFLGSQWQAADRQALLEENRNLWTFNLIRKNINMIEGYQRAHRLSSVVLPQKPEDQQAADDLSDLLTYVMQAGDGYKFISDAFSGALKTGWNLATVWMDYRDDPVNGDIKFGREPYSGFITDPYFTQLNLDDCGYVCRRKYLTAEQCASLLPDKQKEVFDLHSQGYSRDDKFTWLPYQNQPNGQTFMAYDEFYKQMWKQVPVIVDTENGEYTEWTGPKDALKEMLEKYPQLRVVKKPKKFIECHIIVNNIWMKTEVNQFGLDEYPFVPFVGIFEPECELWDLKLQSLVRPMIDPQREVNRRLSQMTDIVESQINSGWIADKDSVINPQSLFQTSQGRVIWRSPGSQPGSIEKIQPAQIPPSMFQLQETFARMMSEILGVNDSAFGLSDSGSETATLMQLRQGAAINNLQGVFDNLRYAQKHLAIKVLKLIQTWNPDKVERILGRKPTEQFYSKDFIKYDISVQEGILTDTQRQMHFRQLVDLYQVTGGPGVSPITPKMLVEAAPIQGESQLLAQIKAQEEQANQSQQAQQQLQMQLIQGQMENQKASALEKVAGAKERFTRAVANVSLSDERSAQAVDDRASAALDRAKAIKELASMDDDQIIKYLQLVKVMERDSKRQEEEIKKDDVAVAAQGQGIGDQLAGVPEGFEGQIG